MALFGGASERLAFVLQLDADGAISGFRKVGATAEKELGRADKSLDRIGGRMQVAGLGMLAFAGVAGKVLLGFAHASAEAEREHLKLTNAIGNSTDAAKYNQQALEDQADALQDVTAADGDAVVGMQALLVQLGRSQDEITALTPLIIDLARKTGADLNDAAKAVTKAIDGQGRALRGLGVDADVSAGSTDNLRHVTEALRSSVGGFAEAEGRTFAGQLEILKNNLGDVAEGIGSGVIPAVQGLVGPLESAANWFTNLDEGTQSMVGQFAVYGTAAIGAVGATSVLVGSLIKARENFSKAADAVSSFAAARGGLAGVGLAAAPAAAGVGIFAAAVYAMSQKAAAAEARTKDLADQIAETGDVAGSVAAQLRTEEFLGDITDNVPHLIDMLRKAGITFDDFATAVGGTGPEFIALRDKMDEAAASGRITGEELTALSAIYELLEEKVEAAKDTADEWAAVAPDTAAATDVLTDSTGQLVVKAEDAAEALRKQQDAAEDLLGLSLDLSEATLGFADSLKEYNDIMGSETTPRTREQIDAANDLQRQAINLGEAALASGDAQARAAGRAATAQAEGAQAQIRSLQSVAGNLAEGSPVRVALEQYIWQLAETQKTRVAHIVADTADAVRDVQALQRALANIPAGVNVDVNYHARPGGGAQASGGPVAAGVVYGPVNERGQETFIPEVNGRILSHSDSMRALARGARSGGGGGIYIGTINLPNVTDSVSFLDELRRLARAGYQNPWEAQ